MLTIKMDTGNAAFGDSSPERNQEAARILRELADSLEQQGGQVFDLTGHDINGNRVAKLTINNRPGGCLMPHTWPDQVDNNRHPARL